MADKSRVGQSVPARSIISNSDPWAAPNFGMSSGLIKLGWYVIKCLAVEFAIDT